MTAEFNASYVGLRHEIVELVPADARRVLDLGCATGTLGDYLLTERGVDAVYGVESDHEMAVAARARLTAVHEMDLERADWAAIGADGPFDCIVAADVLEHLPDPESTLRAAAAALADHGVVVISVPNIRHVSAFWSIFVRGTFPRRSRGLFDETHLRWFTASDLVALCGQAGLAITGRTLMFRLLDRPGGRVNEWLGRRRWPARLPVVRNLLAYQIVVTARRSVT